ncbi:MAG: N-acetylmuramoyl-L-alanine amidase family protein, partial [bacterium]
ILKEALKTTSAKSLGLLKRDWYAGSNYSKVPVTMIEMGFLSNAEEDRKLATEAYRDQVALGIANGVDTYFAS